MLVKRLKKQYTASFNSKKYCYELRIGVPLAIRFSTEDRSQPFAPFNNTATSSPRATCVFPVYFCPFIL
jgi:hypothetical protein